MNDTLTTEELRELTGLTDRRHRQLAEAGHIPQPTNGKWKTVATIQGLLRFYRSSHESKTGKASDLKLERERHRVRREKVLADEAEGKVIGFESAKRVFGLCAAKVKTRVLAAASKLAPLCEGKDLLARQELMTAELTDALGELDRAKLTEKA